MPVPPPPAPPPPPTLALANTEKPSLSRSEQAGRNALLSDITKGKRLKKTVTNDRSAPILDSNTPRPIASSLHNRGSPPVPGVSRQPSLGPSPPPFPGSRGAGPAGPLRQPGPGAAPAFSGRPPLPPTPGRPAEDKPPPPPPPAGHRPLAAREAALPPPPPQNSKPPVPSAPRPNLGAPAPPPPPSRPGPPPVPPVPGGGDEMPRLPQRNISLGSHAAAGGGGRSGPLPPPPSERPPPPVRDPPSRSGPLPPPPPISRNGSTSRALPTTPQLPSRAGLDNQRSGPRPPLPPDRPGSAAPPPPPPPSSAVRNGFQDPGDDEWESRFSFHPISDLPPPEPYVPVNRSYPSKLARNESRGGSGRKERGAPPLPPIPR
ncbi:WAS/WASL-interacting protein family member 1 isoform 1-T1 [Aegotheles albertisi]